MKTRMHNGSRLLSLLLALVLIGALACVVSAEERLVELLFGFGGEIAVIFRFAIVAALSLAGYDRRHGGL